MHKKSKFGPTDVVFLSKQLKPYFILKTQKSLFGFSFAKQAMGAHCLRNIDCKIIFGCYFVEMFCKRQQY